MAKDKKEKPEKQSEAKAFGKYFRTSTQKLNLVAQTIRGKSAAKALVDLEFSRRRVSQDVRKLLQSAVSNAENNHGLDVDRLIVAEASVGKTMKMRRFHARGRGRSSAVEKNVSNMTIVVREAEEAK